MEALALFGLVILVKIDLLFEFVLAVSERTGVRILAGAVEVPKLADLGLELHFEAFDRLVS